jgi:RsiW-degrading membrane proteinase PrsW (M82 family)
MAMPVIIMELILGMFFKTEGVDNFLVLFVSVLVSIAFVEEGAKWIIAKFIGYEDNEFDEIYDIIVYSVFSSIGFACIENILYVLQNGIGVAIGRALLSVPGHMCFGVIMGYFLSRAKINQVNGNKTGIICNMTMSIIVPSLVHALYDALIFYASNNHPLIFYLFIVLDIIMVIICFITVHVVSKIQVNITKNISNGNIVKENNQVVFNYQDNGDSNKYNYCPICGKQNMGSNYCGRCGYRLFK